MSSLPLFGFAGRRIRSRKPLVGRIAQRLLQHGDDLRRPEELVLEVDEPSRRSESAKVRLENRELAARQACVDRLRHRAHDLHFDIARRRRNGLGRQLLSGHLPPAKPEMRGDLRHGGTAQTGGGVVPAERAACRMLGRVEPVAGHRGEVDAADEGGLAVDDHELLVMAVHGPLTRVERDMNAGAVGQGAPDRVDLASIRMKERQRRTGPREETDVDTLRHLCEQLPQRPGIVVIETELRREEPAREPDRRAGGLDRPSDLRQRLGAVHEHLEGVAGERRP